MAKIIGYLSRFAAKWGFVSPFIVGIAVLIWSWDDIQEQSSEVSGEILNANKMPEGYLDAWYNHYQDSILVAKFGNVSIAIDLFMNEEFDVPFVPEKKGITNSFFAVDRFEASYNFDPVGLGAIPITSSILIGFEEKLDAFYLNKLDSISKAVVDKNIAHQYAYLQAIFYEQAKSGRGLVAYPELFDPSSELRLAQLALELSPFASAMPFDTVVSWSAKGRYENILMLFIACAFFSFIWKQSSGIGLDSTSDNAVEGVKYEDYPGIPKIMIYGFKKAQSRAIEIYRRSSIMLISGIAMSVVGIIIFTIYLPNTPNTLSKEDIPGYLLTALRPALILIFVESVAFYLLRQYRILIEDYKYFNSIYMRQLNNLECYAMLTSASNEKTKDLINALLRENVNRVLASGESTEYLEAIKAADDPSDVLSKVLALVEKIKAIK